MCVYMRMMLVGVRSVCTGDTHSRREERSVVCSQRASRSFTRVCVCVLGVSKCTAGGLRARERGLVGWAGGCFWGGTASSITLRPEFRVPNLGAFVRTHTHTRFASTIFALLSLRSHPRKAVNMVVYVCETMCAYSRRDNARFTVSFVCSA